MNEISRKIKALGLCSGGLDSILSALVLRNQGVEVAWITFKTPFFGPEDSVKAAKDHGVPLTVEDITQEYMEMLKNPSAGYGKNMNPCMDCHALMFQKAGEFMKKEGYDFLFSGEVVGQRPKSQTKNSLRYVEKRSGCDGLILRPLSAGLLPETSMEKNGLVNREKLCAISGRSRKIQMEMAEDFGVLAYPSPAGGCLLTDQGFSRRLKDLLFVQKEYSKKHLYLLGHGRHFRLDDQTRVVVGRSKGDNQEIKALFDPARDLLIRRAGGPGPTLLMPAGAVPEMVREAAALCLGYARVQPGESARVSIKGSDGEQQITVTSLDPAQFTNKFI